MLSSVRLDSYSLYLIQRDFVTCPVVKFCCPRRLMGRDSLCVLDRSTIFEIRSDTGRTKGMAADFVR